jgi:rieske iron-sulfur protein
MTKDQAWEAASGGRIELPVDHRGGGCGEPMCCQQTPPDGRRRALLGGLVGGLLSPFLLRPGEARAADGAKGEKKDPRKMRAQAGDQLVFKATKRKGEIITLADVEIGAKPLVAYPYDPVGEIIRKGSRLNQILVLRLAEEDYTEKTRARAVDGVIAYSAICSHQNCPVTGWHREHHQFICPCHETYYDPKDGARVVSGPAKRALPALPLTAKDGVLTAADGLTGKVGRRKRT